MIRMMLLAGLGAVSLITAALGQGRAPMPHERPPLPARAPFSGSPPASQPPDARGDEAKRQPLDVLVGCQARLASKGIVVEPVPSPPFGSDAACVIDTPVRLISAHQVMFPDRPLLACAMAERFASLTEIVIAPLARGHFGESLTAVATGPGFECRPRNRVAGAKLSVHGQGLAVDVMMIEVTRSRKVIVETPKDATEQAFLAGIRAAGCGLFHTVLGPGADAAHANHIHLDLEARGHDGHSRLCQ